MIRRTNMFRKRNDESDDSTSSDVTAVGSRVYFYADVSRGTILQLLKALNEANEHAIKYLESPRVHLFLHSNGGDAFAGLSAMDHIKNNPVPVITVADGMVASAASFMLLASPQRRILPHSFVRIHQISITGFEGKYVEFVDEMKNTQVLMDMITNVYVQTTHMSADRVHEILKTEIDMNAEQCIEEGLVQEVFTKVNPCPPLCPPPCPSSKRKKRKTGDDA